MSKLAGRVGFDWCLVDMEHSPNDASSLTAQLQALEVTGTPAVVRVVSGEDWLIKQALDSGAQSILVPMVNTPAQALAAAKAMRYAPEGTRGMGASLARASHFSLLSDYVKTTNEQVLCIVQAETVDPITKLVVPGRKTPRIEGDFVVFLIGSRPNRAIDKFYKFMGDAMSSIMKELEEHPDCLGTEGSFVGSAGTLMVPYWKSQEALNEYARSASNHHAHPWAKVMAMGRECPDYAFWHETFLVKDGNYEAIYVNSAPIMLGNCKGVTLEDCKGRMATAAGRTGKTDGSDYPKELGEPNY